MQSLLIFIAEFQAAKRRLLNDFEVSDNGRFSVERNEDTPGCESLKPVNLSEKTHHCMKVEKLLRTECYRTRSVATKTESVSPNGPRTRRRSFLSRLGRMRDYSSANNDQKSP